MPDVPDAAIIAVLTKMDWPDDREFSAHVEPDGYELTPPGAYWDMARDIAAAVLRTLLGDAAVTAAATMPRAHAWHGRRASNSPDRYTDKGPATPTAQKPCGCVGKCPSLFKPCPVCGGEVRAVGVDNALAVTYHPCGHVVPDDEDTRNDRQEP